VAGAQTPSGWVGVQPPATVARSAAGRFARRRGRTRSGSIGADRCAPTSAAENGLLGQHVGGLQSSVRAWRGCTTRRSLREQTTPRRAPNRRYLRYLRAARDDVTERMR
jgi:hypothetical protein